jgi:hypothetical protein
LEIERKRIGGYPTPVGYIQIAHFLDQLNGKLVDLLGAGKARMPRLRGGGWVIGQSFHRLGLQVAGPQKGKKQTERSRSLVERLSHSLTILTFRLIFLQGPPAIRNPRKMKRPIARWFSAARRSFRRLHNWNTLEYSLRIQKKHTAGKNLPPCRCKKAARGPALFPCGPD